MAEDEIVDYGEDDYFAWFYVEDDYPLADELAETQIPSPGYAGMRDELPNEYYDDFDMFEYWDDLKYGDDEYWDSGGIGVPTAGQKRRRATTMPDRSIDKKRKLSLKDTEGDNVRFIPMMARIKMANRQPPKVDRRHSFALLPDWRQRFAGTTGLAAPKSMPVEMRKAAESTNVDTPPKERQHDVKVTHEQDEDGDWEDEDGEEEALDVGQNEELMKMLTERLKGTPLEGMDNGLLMQSMGELLSGSGSGGALDNLTSSLLEGKNEGLSSWLSQQGVSLDANDCEEEDDDDLSIEVSKPKASASKPSKRTAQTSPHDSAVGISKGATAELALHGSSPLAKKRAAPSDETASGRKRKKVVFDIAEEESTHAQVGFSPSVAAQRYDDDSIAVAPAPADEEESIAVAPAQANEDENITVSSSKSANTKAVRNNKSKSGTVDDSSEAITGSANDGGAEDDMEDNIDVHAKPNRAPSVRQTRKRKADAEELEVDGIGPVQKRQARKIASAKGASDEVVGRRTRSARAKVGK